MAKMDKTILTELFKMWIEKNPDELKDASPEGIIVAWVHFRDRVKKKWDELNPPGKVGSIDW